MSGPAFVVRILGPGGRPAGAGALVAARRILTCAHVVNLALGRDPGSREQPAEAVTVDFPFAAPGLAARGGLGYQATVGFWLPPPRDGALGADVAGLFLTDADAAELAARTVPGKLAADLPRAGRPVRLFGYPDGQADGAAVLAAIRDRTADGRLRLDLESAPHIEPGFGGSPVFDEVIGRIVGMVAPGPAGLLSPERDVLAVDGEHLRLAWPEVLARVGRPTPGGTREHVTIAHVSDMRFGSAGDVRPDPGVVCDAIITDVGRLADEHGVHPDLLVVTGDLTEAGLPSQLAAAADFIGRLAEAAEIPRRRVAIVPGNHDVNRRACQAYFAERESEEEAPVPPYFPKWGRFAAMLAEFYGGAAGCERVAFTPDEPWTLFEMPDLGVVVAGLNSTIADSHLDADHYGLVGERQLEWFGRRLARHRVGGSLRVAAVHHGTSAGSRVDARYAIDLDKHLGFSGAVNLMLCGDTDRTALTWLPSDAPLLASRYQLITVRRDGFTRYGRRYDPGQQRWIGDVRVDPTGAGWRDDRVHPLTAVRAIAPTETEGMADAWPGEDRAWTLALDQHVLDDPKMRARIRVRYVLPGDVHLAGSPEEEFLVSVADATRVRWPEATVALRPDQGYLRVSIPLPGGGAEQLPIGVICGPATDAGLAAFTDGVHAQFAAADPGVRSELVHGGAASRQLVDAALRRGVRLRSFVEYQGLLDLSPLATAQAERLKTDRFYPARLYVTQRYRVEIGGAHEIRDGLVEQAVEWLGADDSQLLVVLGEFGRGKTSFLRQLARTLPNELPTLLPVLVELRGLEKAPTLDELLAQHLVRETVTNINLTKLRYMIHSGRIALLFDGFDELELRVGYENAAEYLQVLLASVTGRAKVILTSRTQHFLTTQQVRTAFGDRVAALPGSRVVVLEGFRKDQILQFLGNRYEGDVTRAQARFDLLRDVGNLLELAHNPRMLAFASDLDEHRLRAVVSRQGQVGAADLYREIIDFWLDEEVKRQRHHGGLASLDKQERFDACTVLALRLWASTDRTLALHDLSAGVSATLTRLAERGYSNATVTHSIGSGSLLVTTEDGAFAFVHQSIMEWLVANEAVRLLSSPDGAQFLGSRSMSRLMTEFFLDLGKEAAWQWVDATLKDLQATQAAKQNALAAVNQMPHAMRRFTWTQATGPRTGKVDSPEEIADTPASPNTPDRLSVIPGIDFGVSAAHTTVQKLAHVDLRGQDLSGLDLHGADMFGADLRGTRLAQVVLAGADLTEADLRGAQLRDIDLSRANLYGADLRGARLWDTDLSGATLASADLRGARLFGGSLRSANLDRSRWDYAAILGTIGVDNLVAAPELQVAALAGRDPATIMTHSYTAPSGIAFSPDGMIIAIATGTSVLLADPADGTAIRVLVGLSSWVTAMAFTPDSTRLATGTEDGTTHIWDLTDSEPTTRATLTAHTETITDLAFSPDGTRLATASLDSTARIWDLTGPAVDITALTPMRHGNRLRAVAFFPDGTRLATVSENSTIHIWDLTGPGVPITLNGHANRTEAIAVFPDGTRLATASEDGTVQIWDLTGPKPTINATLRAHSGNATALAFSPDGTSLGAASSDGTTRILDLAGPKPGTEVTLTDQPRMAAVLAFSPEGTRLATGSEEGTTLIRDLTGSKTAHVVMGANADWMQAVAFPPDGTRLATGTEDGTIKIWDLTESVTCTNPSTLAGHKCAVRSVMFSPDGTRLATTTEDGNAHIWDLARSATCTALGTAGGLIGWVPITAFSPDSTRLAITTGNGGATRIWDLTEPEPGIWTTLHGRTDTAVMVVAFSPDSTRLATATRDGAVQVWDLAESGSATCITVRGPGGVVASLAFSPDGSRLATGSDDGITQVWDLTKPASHTNPSTPWTLTGHTDTVTVLAFSPDGSRLATGSDDGITQVWDLTKPVSHTVLPTPWTLTVHTSLVRMVMFSPDGSRLAATTLDGITKVWDLTGAATLAIPLTLTGHISWVPTAAFSPDSTRLTTASLDGTARIWDVTTGDTLATFVMTPNGGYAVETPDGYRIEGDPGNDIWWAMKLCRFAPGELDPYVPGLRPLEP